MKLAISVQVGEEGKLFGSVTAREIADLIIAQGVEIDRRAIELGDPIKEAGAHTVSVKLHRDVVAQVRLEVTPRVERGELARASAALARFSPGAAPRPRSRPRTHSAIVCSAAVPRRDVARSFSVSWARGMR